MTLRLGEPLMTIQIQAPPSPRLELRHSKGPCCVFFFFFHFSWFLGFLFPLKELGSPNSGFLHLYSSMALKKTVPEKRKRVGSSSRAPPPPPDNPEKFFTREAEKLYHESLFNRTFIEEHDIPDSNIYFTS